MEINQAVEMIKVERGEIAQELASIQIRRGEIETEIARLRALPISLDDWGQYLKSEIERLGSSWMGRFPSALLSRGSYKKPHNERGWSDFEREDGSFSTLPLDEGLITYGEGALDGLCAIFPEAVYSTLMARIKARVGGRWGNIEMPTVSERRAAIEQIELEAESLDEKRRRLEERLASLM